MSARTELAWLDRGYKGDAYYYLSKDERGHWQIEFEEREHHPNKAPTCSVIPMSEWNSRSLNGTSLAKLASDKISLLEADASN